MLTLFATSSARSSPLARFPSSFSESGPATQHCQVIGTQARIAPRSVHCSRCLRHHHRLACLLLPWPAYIHRPTPRAVPSLCRRDHPPWLSRGPSGATSKSECCLKGACLVPRCPGVRVQDPALTQMRINARACRLRSWRSSTRRANPSGPPRRAPSNRTSWQRVKWG